MSRRLAVLVWAFLVAGCSTPATPEGDGPFAAHHEERQVPETASYSGLHVEGILDGGGARLKLDAEARNDGSRTYKVETGCGSPWNEELLQDGERLQMREPMVRCLAFSLRDFPPGDRIEYHGDWNGTLWDDQEGGYVAAPAGEYLWSAQFIAYSDQSGALKRFDLDFPVTVR